MWITITRWPAGNYTVKVPGTPEPRSFRNQRDAEAYAELRSLALDLGVLREVW